ncbi:MAG TPA: hypothetical protein EYP19_12005 [Desulfobacterales bacterium]|nr:hypothetical protein [Desulfobacterales bacterium]
MSCQQNKTTTEQQVESPPPPPEVEIGKDYRVYDKDGGKHGFFHGFSSLSPSLTKGQIRSAMGSPHFCGTANKDAQRAGKPLSNETTPVDYEKKIGKARGRSPGVAEQLSEDRVRHDIGSPQKAP